MRTLVAAVALSIVLTPAVARAQRRPTVSLHAGGGPTTYDSGHNLSAAIGFSPTPRFTLLATVDRTHLESRTTIYPDGYSFYRGGTMTSVIGELRVNLLVDRRVSPYGSIGLGAGTWRSNPTEDSPNPEWLDTRFLALGAGATVPIGRHLGVFSDFRLLVGGSENSGMVAMGPLRAGVSLRF